MDGEIVSAIMEIIFHGGVAEVKQVKGEIVVVDITRKVKIKTPITG